MLKVTVVPNMTITFNLAFKLIAFSAVVVITFVHGYRDGAPELSCESMTPSRAYHRADSSNMASLPYAVSINFNKAGVFEGRNHQ